jgi:hypothetical protein
MDKKRMKRKKLLGSMRKKEERTKKEERCGWKRKENKIGLVDFDQVQGPKPT